MKKVSFMYVCLTILACFVFACGGGGGGTSSVTMGSDTTPPMISDPQPSGQQATGTTSVTMHVTTNENATCRYSSSDAAYSSMTAFTTTGGTSHSTTISGLTNGNSYTRYVRCQDVRGNTNSSSAVVAWSIGSATDTTPPVLSNPLPSEAQSSGTTSVSMQVTTNENATCRYSSASGTAYASMTNAFTTTGGTSHATQITGLANGETYTRYVRCQDVAGNANTSDTTVTWSVASATGSATLTWGASPVDATHSAPDGYNVYRCGPVTGTCNNFSLLTTTAQLTYTSTGLASGTYCFQITAYNTAGESAAAICNSGNCCKLIP